MSLPATAAAIMAFEELATIIQCLRTRLAMKGKMFGMLFIRLEEDSNGVYY